MKLCVSVRALNVQRSLTEQSIRKEIDMKRLITAVSLCLIVTLAFLSFEAHSAGIVNMVGTWTIQSSTVNANGYSNSTTVVKITSQKGACFKGRVVPGDPPNTNFYGAVDGDQVYITFWDCAVSGVFTSPGKIIKFVGQNQQKDPPNSPGTSIGTMTRE
jgi:hypothetical protein